MPSPPLDLPRFLKEFEMRSRDLADHPIHWGLIPEFERRVRMLEREYVRHLNALVQEFRSRSRVLERQSTKKNPERVRQSKEGWLKRKALH